MGVDIFNVSGVAIKNGSVLLTMDKPKTWSCPTFTFTEKDDPALALINEMEKSLGLIENASYEDAKWFDIESISSMGVRSDSRLAILKYESGRDF